MSLPRALFAPGQVSYPAGVQRALHRAGLHGVTLVIWHMTGVWGNIDDKRRQVNHRAIAHVWPSLPVISRYPLPGGRQVMVLTRHLHQRRKRQTTLSLLDPPGAAAQQGGRHLSKRHNIVTSKRTGRRIKHGKIKEVQR